MAHFEHPPMPKSSGAQWSGKATIGPHAGQQLTRQHPTLASHEDIEYTLPPDGNGLLADHGLSEYRGSPAEDEEEHYALQELRRKQAEQYSRLSPAAQLAAQARAEFLQRETSPSPGRQLPQPPSRSRGSSLPSNTALPAKSSFEMAAAQSVAPTRVNVPQVLSPRPRPHAEKLGSPFIPRSSSAEQLPVAGADVRVAPLASQPMIRSQAQYPQSRKASVTGSGVTKDELIDLLAKALKQEQRKAKEQEMRKQLYKKEYEAAVKDLQKLGEDTDALITEYRRSLETHVVHIKGLERQVAALRDEAAHAHEVEPEVADRYMRMLASKEHHIDRSRFNEELASYAVGDSVHLVEGVALGGLSSEMAGVLRSGGGVSELVRGRMEERNRRIDSTLTGIANGRVAVQVDTQPSSDTSMLHVETHNLSNASPDSVHSPLVLTKDGLVRGQPVKPDVGVGKPKRQNSGRRNFSFPLGNNRRRSRSSSNESNGPPPASRPKVGSATGSEVTVEASRVPPGAYPAEKPSQVNPTMLAPPQMALAQADGTYGRSASSEVPRKPNVEAPVPRSPVRERRLSLSKVLGKMFPVLGTSSSDFPDVAKFETKASDASDTSSECEEYTNTMSITDSWPVVRKEDWEMPASEDEDDYYFSPTLGGYYLIPRLEATEDDHFVDTASWPSLPSLIGISACLLLLLTGHSAALMFVALIVSLVWYMLIVLDEVQRREEEESLAVESWY